MTTEERKWGHNNFTHHLIEIREPPPSIVELRNLLQEAQHADLFEASKAGKDFGESLGILAARLDIALDGDYDVDNLCRMLVTCLKARFVNVSTPHLRSPGLVNARLEEAENEIRLVEAVENTVDPAAGEAWTLYMQRVECATCYNTQLCKSAGKCLRLPEEEAIKAQPAGE